MKTIISITLAWVLGISCTKEKQPELNKQKIRIRVEAYEVNKCFINKAYNGEIDKLLTVKYPIARPLIFDNVYMLRKNASLSVLLEVKDIPEIGIRDTITIYKNDTIVYQIFGKPVNNYLYVVD